MKNTKKSRVSIIGCGWLGKPLFQRLSIAYEVLCYTRKKEEADFENYYYNPQKQSPFWDCDYAVVAISTKDHYLETLEQIALQLRADSTFIFMSSISVYREYDGDVNEESVITQSNRQYEAEQLIQHLRENAVILRLGGLMGEDRISGRWSKASVFTDGPVNYIHRDDVIGVVETILSQKISTGVFNVVAPEHPLRSSVHRSNAKRFGFKAGRFEGMSMRKVDPLRLHSTLNYRFIHPDPLRFW